MLIIDNSICVSLLWLLPLLLMFVIFSSQPSQLLRSVSCSQHSALHSPVFRAGFTSAIFLPVTLIILTYLYFYHILSRRTRYQGLLHTESESEYSDVCRLSTITTAIQKQNMRAARITLLILFSCLICWVPASLTHLLFCPSGGHNKGSIIIRKFG